MAWLKLFELADFSLGSAKEFFIEGRIVALFRTTNDEVFAVDGICAHQGGPLAQGNLDKKCITCPWHGWQYDVSTGENLLSGKKLLDCFDTKIAEGWILIDLPA